MCKRRVKESFFVFTFVVVFGMTPLSFADQTSIGENPNKPLTQEIKDETVDVSQTIKNYTIKQRDEAVKNAKAALIVLDARIDRMENQLYKKWNQMDESARKEARATMQSLRKQRNEVAEWYGSLKHSSVAAWRDVKKGFSDSYRELRNAFVRAEREF